MKSLELKALKITLWSNIWLKKIQIMENVCMV